MKLIINGKQYDGKVQPFIGDLRKLKPAFGFGYGEVMKRLEALEEDTPVAELLDDDKFSEALVAWMWMTRLRAGEREVTVEEVWMTPLDGFQMVGDDTDAPIEHPEDASDDADPTAAPTDSRRGAGGELPAVASDLSLAGTSTTTSKQPSTSD